MLSKQIFVTPEVLKEIKKNHNTMYIACSSMYHMPGLKIADKSGVCWKSFITKMFKQYEKAVSENPLDPDFMVFPRVGTDVFDFSKLKELTIDIDPKSIAAAIMLFTNEPSPACLRNMSELDYDNLQPILSPYLLAIFIKMAQIKSREMAELQNYDLGSFLINDVLMSKLLKAIISIDPNIDLDNVMHKVGNAKQKNNVEFEGFEFSKKRKMLDDKIQTGHANTLTNFFKACLVFYQSTVVISKYSNKSGTINKITRSSFPKNIAKQFERLVVCNDVHSSDKLAKVTILDKIASGVTKIYSSTHAMSKAYPELRQKNYWTEFTGAITDLRSLFQSADFHHYYNTKHLLVKSMHYRMPMLMAQVKESRIKQQKEIAIIRQNLTPAPVVNPNALIEETDDAVEGNPAEKNVPITLPTTVALSPYLSTVNNVISMQTIPVKNVSVVLERAREVFGDMGIDTGGAFIETVENIALFNGMGKIDETMNLKFGFNTPKTRKQSRSISRKNKRKKEQQKKKRDGRGRGRGGRSQQNLG